MTIASGTKLGRYDIRSQPGAGAATAVKGGTSAEVIIGTASYLSREQVRG